MNYLEVNCFEGRMMDRIEETARKWHDGQLRKDGVTPYI